MGFFLSPWCALEKGGLAAQTPHLFEVRIQLLSSPAMVGWRFPPQILSLESLQTWPRMKHWRRFLPKDKAVGMSFLLLAWIHTLLFILRKVPEGRES
jgi:hypothetical protein